MKPLTLSLLSMAVVFTAACSGGPSTTENPPPKPTATTATTAPATEPAKPSGGLGPACTAYVACCKQVVAKTPQAGASCDSFEAQAKKTADTATLESSCQSGHDAFKQAGACS